MGTLCMLENKPPLEVLDLLSHKTPCYNSLNSYNVSYRKGSYHSYEMELATKRLAAFYL